MIPLSRRRFVEQTGHLIRFHTVRPRHLRYAGADTKISSAIRLFSATERNMRTRRSGRVLSPCTMTPSPSLSPP
jgi:hypothetical protein